MREKKRKKKWRLKGRKREKLTPHVAVYLDELEDLGMSDDDIAKELEKVVEKQERRKNHDHPDWVEDDKVDTTEYTRPSIRQIGHKMRSSIQQRKKQKKSKTSKSTGWKYFKYFLVVLLILHLPAIYGIASALRWQTFSTRSQVPDTKGILLLGVDNEGPNSITTGHTDSITYLAANFKTNKAITLPIYRDANIMQTCTGTEDNINRIYGNHGIYCLVESVAKLFDLPVDYYAVVTIQGLINIIDSLGSVKITPSSSYCSDYGEDGKTYCFIAGQTQPMNGAQALAYIRYRGSHSGEVRANRQMELIYAIKNHCSKHLLSCYINIPPELSQGVRTNIPLTEAFSLAKIFSPAFDMEALEVIAGSNVEGPNGWMQYISMYDLVRKTQIIREEIYQ